MTQEKFVKVWLEENGEITPLDAYKEFAIMRLSSIILRLRKQGMDIKTDYTTARNRFGVDVTFATYKLKRLYKVVYDWNGTECVDYIKAYDGKDLKKKFQENFTGKLKDYWVV